MPEKITSQTQAPPPHAQLAQMAQAHWVSDIVYVAAKLSLADHLAEGPKSADEIAGPTGTHAPSLYRLMRALANLGILTEDVAHCFALTPLGEALKTGAPGSARATILTFASDWWVRGFGQLLYSVETGKSGFEKSLGMPIFDWLANHPEDASLFSETMVGVHGAEPAAVAAAYDFSGLTTIVDVGGATGHLLTTILASYPECPWHPLRSPACRSRRSRADSGARPGGPRHDRGGQFLRERSRAAAMPIFSRTSSTTGAKSSA